MVKNLVLSAGYTFSLLLLVTQSANAVTVDSGNIINLSFNQSSPDVRLAGGVFSTIPDDTPNPEGDLITTIEFVGDLSYLNEYFVGSSFLLRNVQLSEGMSINGDVASQNTKGGYFVLLDPNNGEMLSGQLGAGSFVGGVYSYNAVFTSEISLVGGWLLDDWLLEEFRMTTPVAISLFLSDVRNQSGGPGFGLSYCRIPGTSRGIGDFTAEASASIGSGDTPSFPEPFTAGLVSIGLISSAFLKRRKTIS
jgi:hypothetical protein